MRRGDLRRLERLETPTCEQYELAFRRAALRVIRELGAALTDEETTLLSRDSQAGDAETLRLHRASLPERGAKKEGTMLLSAAYKEVEDRGADPWRKEDFTELADALDAQGYDALGMRYFLD